MNLVDYQLYKKSFAPGSSVTVGRSVIDFVVLVKANLESPTNISDNQSSELEILKRGSYLVYGNQSSLPIEIFKNDGKVDVFLISGKRVAVSLNEQDYQAFYRNPDRLNKIYIVKMSHLQH